MKNKALIIVALLIVALVASGFHLVNTWRHTPYGTLDPKVAILLKIISGPGENSFNPDIPIEENRAALEKLASFVAGTPTPLEIVKDIVMTGTQGAIPARIYAPDAKRHPIIVFFHGGGWVRGSIHTHDNICRALALKANALVVSVDYRLAPEHAFPAAVNDAYDALLYVYHNAESLKGDPSCISVAGDSSGGNLAAVVAQMARDKGGPAIAFQVLIYPVTNLAETNSESYRNFSEGYILTRSDMEAYISLYAPDAKDRVNPYASPLLAADFTSLPPAIIITDQFDVLRDEGEAYARKLEAAGVLVKKKKYEGVIHGFVSADRFLTQADDAIDLIATTLEESCR